MTSNYGDASLNCGETLISRMNQIPVQNGNLFTEPQDWFSPMKSSRQDKSSDESPSLGIVTIDDLKDKAQRMSDGFKDFVADLERLGAYKHPLDVRRGVPKGVSALAGNETSKTLKAGSKTYFFDIQKAENGKPYLKITESRFKGTEKESTRSSIIIFPEDAQEFAGAVREMISHLAGE